jgi:hypothetical protein
MSTTAKKLVKRKARKRAGALKRRTAAKRWSGNVTKHSDALDLDAGVFTWKDPRRIAASLKASAEASSRRKADPYRSALSMLTFYISRAGKNLPEARKDVLRRAKTELRKAFGRQRT